MRTHLFLTFCAATADDGSVELSSLELNFGADRLMQVCRKAVLQTVVLQLVRITKIWLVRNFRHGKGVVFDPSKNANSCFEHAVQNSESIDFCQ